MPADAKTPEGFSLRRWSRRKLDAARDAASSEAPAPAIAGTGAQGPAATAPSVPDALPPAAEPALPPVESLTGESDFTAFMHPEVDEGLRRQALKKLFADPHFNVMDGLDVYIDDYTKPDPIPPDVLERLAQSGFVRGLGLGPVEGPPPPPAFAQPVEPPPEPRAIAEDVPASPEPGAVSPAGASAPVAVPKDAAEPSGSDDPSVPRPPQ
jgi:hypothetical protein